MNSIFTHSTFEVDKQELDFFYIKHDPATLDQIAVRLDQEFPLYFMTSFKVSKENGFLTVSIDYHCNPIFKGMSPMLMGLKIPGCGVVYVKWLKSCGDFSHPPRGLNVEFEVPQKYANTLDISKDLSDSFVANNSTLFLNYTIFLDFLQPFYLIFADLGLY